MTDLKKVVNFYLNSNTSSLKITISEHYGSEIEFAPGGQQVLLWEEGEPWLLQIEEHYYAYKLMLMARFAINLWGAKAPTVLEGEGDLLELATEDIVRKGDWQWGNFQEVGGPWALKAARKWPHYKSLEATFQPFMAAFHS